ncbi:Aluminum activated malate transporter family protein [Hibiscus syriacus]|uniref:Aluminum activated malate transporter family protein n=1 Tax=Hibiscus syriacus TaxID=106335 RepID=A0A6A2ZJQ8_HIBSY|nr:Aluminum activated malate transporter family protein [Hibiscus syriacus]
MDLECGSEERAKQGLLARVWPKIKTFSNNVKSEAFEFFTTLRKLGQDDPRRVVHSLKAGLALTLVSLFYYYQPLYDSFGVSTMWAVMTVVVIFEFSVGATLGKGVNIGLATLFVGALAVGAHQLANLSGRIDNEILKLAHKRLLTVLIGGSTCVTISVLIFPVWAGQDLHNLIASNMEKLGIFLEGFGDEYFRMAEDGESKEGGSFMQGYKSVLNSKNNEEDLAKPEIRTKIQETCTIMSMESGEALKELSMSIKLTVKPFAADICIDNSKLAVKNLNALLKSGLRDDETDLLEVVTVATVASLLIDVVSCTAGIAEPVHELSTMLNFETVEPTVSPKTEPEIVIS